MRAVGVGAVTALQTDGKVVVSGSLDKTIKVANLKDGALVKTMRSHTDAVTCLQFMHSTAVSGSRDMSLVIW